jgi:peptidyl-prolyl cis-trans isomerase B (cyclophilin B)
VSRVKLQTSLGDIVLELDAAKAPGSVDNFLQYVKDGFYDNTVFHRVINGFMVQGGGFEPGM